MNSQERAYFAGLSKDRAESADMLEKPSMRGIKKSVVDKYSDQAHFIYELLQNADDAKATRARFVLEKDRLIFAHNGSRRFSVSDPSNEDADSTAGTLGDINAITSIANSNKREASIGKFGVGFKAVFQYTSTPHIYDPNFRFRIDRFIVPILLESDFDGRREDETLFVFPFDHPDRNAEAAYSDIADKLQSLSYPLLFLSRLKEIEFSFGSTIGLYGKRIEKAITYDQTIAEHICLTQNAGDDLYDENLWLFSRLDDSQRRYSVGFFMDPDGHLKPASKPAFCFFPTKEITRLNFIFHAPFLLTDSREGILAGVAHNDNMIQCLANLAADALEYLKDIGNGSAIRLIDDNIVSIIPVDPEKFSSPSDKSRISFLPFYHAIKQKLEKECLLPAIEGYVSSNDAYWAAVPQLPQLFSNVQLADIVDNNNAHWVFPSLGRDEIQRNNRPLYAYIDALVRTNINEDVIINGRSRDFFFLRGVRQSLENIKGITAAFIEAQSFEWLHSFYKWISETKHRKEIAVTKPVFLDQDRHAVAAFDDDDQLILFLPVNDVEGYTVVHPELLKNPETKQFIIDIGVKQPSLKDQIYTIILPQYKDGGSPDSKAHFQLFFKYYCKCSTDEVDEFIDLLKDYQILRFHEDGKVYRIKANQLYLPSQELRRYFATKPTTRFVDYDGYIDLVGREQEKYLLSFLSELGVKTTPSILEENTGSYNHHEYERSIDGLEELVTAVVETQDPSLSVYLWGQLCSFVDNNLLAFRVLNKEIKWRPDGRYNFRTSYQESATASILKTSAWILREDGAFVSSENVTRDQLSPDYEVDSDAARSLLDIIGIAEASHEEPNDAEDDSNLTDSQRERIALADKFREYGIESEEDLAEFQEFRRQREAAKRAAAQTANDSHKPAHTDNQGKSTEQADDDFAEIYGDDSSDEYDHGNGAAGTTSGSTSRTTMSKRTKEVLRDIVRRTKESHTTDTSISTADDADDFDQDELMPSTVDYQQRIERAKQKSAAEIEKIAHFEELQNRAVTAKKYSFGWFKALLEMEALNSGEANANSKEVSISFSTVEREQGTKRTLILKHPNRYIPQFMEDLADIPLVLHMGDQTKTVAIEVANIKSYTLRVKMKNSADIQGIDLSCVTAATIDAKSPAFLIDELRKQFIDFGYEDDFDMQEQLCENIEFVFGPPGTGKTTHLARNVLLPLMAEDQDYKVLVLTPTNKAADVLVRRVMEIAGADHSYEKWLVRFGATGDEDIEQSPVYKDKTFDIRTMAKNITVTTIARFPYDFFMPEGARIFLNGINWDYIVIDEASMIPIANIVFPLYKKTPQKFIIAGDPFQIEPITSVSLWKNENIYTMVQLNSFENPTTTPHQYKVELLTTQYRSIPDIGSIFSHFTYGGILKHYRDASTQRALNIGSEIKTLNILKFPVSKYESIYRSKRLQHGSPYQVYSALFTFEYVAYLAKRIASNNPGSQFKIGVVAPYRAQADMIDKLLASERLPKDVDVQVDTIHGFQGDECDIVFVVFNTPPSISASKEMFLNKRNIINVSVSRAKDYLFIVMPDDQTANIDNLRLVKRIEALMKNTSSWQEVLTPTLEKMMFDDDRYFENNAFSTSHQSVNVYGLPEKRYEVRTEDNAVDVQIHRGALTVAPAAPVERSSQVPEADNSTNTIISPPATAVDEPEEPLVDKPESDFVLDPDTVPKALRAGATEINVQGEYPGKYYLVPYNGKLKKFTDKKTTPMFIPQLWFGNEKLVAVSVISEDHIIFIDKNTFKMYEKGLCASDRIELVTKPTTKG
ncbi:MAG: AAA domain-containing protein [Eubacteriales bacterium]|jgi:hypothetical protein